MTPKKDENGNFISVPCEFCGIASYFPCELKAQASECDNNVENARSWAKADLGKMLYEQLEKIDPGYGYGLSWEEQAGQVQDIYIQAILAVITLGQDKIAKLIDLDE